MANWRLTRNDTAAFVEFDEDMQWVDEYNWQKIAQSTERALSGSLIIQQGIKLGGREITLQGEWVWHRKDKLDTLLAWSEVAELEMTLTHYDGRAFTVAFRHEDAGIGAEPVVYRTPERPEHQYTATVRLLTI